MGYAEKLMALANGEIESTKTPQAEINAVIASAQAEVKAASLARRPQPAPTATQPSPEVVEAPVATAEAIEALEADESNDVDQLTA
jgi:hypothetical protein